MSRCFPYPPPGYSLSRASKDALIESIKFQNGRVKSKEQKKEKRKEKKEKRKEKKDKKSDKSHIVQTQITEKSWAETKSGFLFKGNKAEPEQLERSGLTEEHSKPMCLRAPSTSSDSTENSNKRKRHSSPSDLTRGGQVNNKIIRIKLPLKKQKTTDVLAIEQHPCSALGLANVITENKDVICRTVKEQICSTSHPTETFVAPKTPKKPANKVLTPMQRAELQYESLLDNLVPLQSLDDADNLDWLLKGKNRESYVEKKLTSSDDSMPRSISWGLWPKAQYLQEVDVYALPFSVPF